MNCPNCGAPARPGARFCGQCRSTLDVAPAIKTCPQCGKSNREAAKFCGECGFTFPATAAGQPAAAGLPGPAGPLSPAAGTPARRGGTWRRGLVAGVGSVGLFVLVIAIALIGSALKSSRSGVAGAVVTPTSSPPTRIVRPTGVPTRSGAVAPTPQSGAPFTPAASPRAERGLRQALLATVQIIVPVGVRSTSSGSGSVLTPQGHILTNFHVIGDPDTGKLYGRSGEIYVAVSPPDLRGEPDMRYFADVVEVDRNLDLALLKISGLTTGRPLPEDLGLTIMPVGDSDTVNIGDQLSIIGFPGLGGATVTLTKGSVSGFLTGEGWIKTDAEINSGNSGGSAINANGELVGIPSEANAERTEVPGKIGLVRPVNLARPLIDLALRDGR